ncbi:MAG: sugar transferase, partial [Lachnospiraceae bacterium]|nr:sugar transferase [Lachnospiraceae bacterium]
IGLTIEQRIIKRTLDIVFSILALVLTSPIMLVTAICIKAYDGGPVFYRQERTTFRGKKFWIIKFRSMVENAEADGKANPASDDDDRITPVGRFIRKTRIDELPQFLNILKGEMSIVGPRPERVEHMEKYAEVVPEFDYRLKVKGGLTGYAQVYGKYNTTPLDKLKMDLMYIVNYSILLDIQIFFETVKVIFKSEATEGFTEKQKKRIKE